MLKTFKYRIYPTRKQQVLINKGFGFNQYVYNGLLITDNLFC